MLFFVPYLIIVNNYVFIYDILLPKIYYMNDYLLTLEGEFYLLNILYILYIIACIYYKLKHPSIYFLSN
jgi:hypothetical protein